MKILTKIIALFLVLTILPLSILGYLAVENINDTGTQAQEQVQELGNKSVEQSSQALQELGEKKIQQKARMVAKQIQIYIRENPQMTVEDLQQDKYFQKIAVQKVGETGYTAVTDYETLKCRFHESEAIVDQDLENLSNKLPGFWKIMKETRGGIESQGYYKWEEPDGSIKDKYMYIALVKNVKTADGVGLHVAATTYIDEFTDPVEETKQEVRESTAETKEEVETSVTGMQNTTLSIVFVMLVIVAAIGLVFTHSFIVPIKKLTDAADEVTRGDLDETYIETDREDELGELANALKRAMVSINYYKEKAENQEETLLSPFSYQTKIVEILKRKLGPAAEDFAREQCEQMGITLEELNPEHTTEFANFVEKNATEPLDKSTAKQLARNIRNLRQ